MREYRECGWCTWNGRTRQMSWNKWVVAHNNLYSFRNRTLDSFSLSLLMMANCFLFKCWLSRLKDPPWACFRSHSLTTCFLHYNPADSMTWLFINMLITTTRATIDDSANDHWLTSRLLLLLNHWWLIWISQKERATQCDRLTHGFKLNLELLSFPRTSDLLPIVVCLVVVQHNVQRNQIILSIPPIHLI